MVALRGKEHPDGKEEELTRLGKLLNIRNKGEKGTVDDFSVFD